jgi:hypothetical protein
LAILTIFHGLIFWLARKYEFLFNLDENQIKSGISSCIAPKLDLHAIHQRGSTALDFQSPCGL